MINIRNKPRFPNAFALACVFCFHTNIAIADSVPSALETTTQFSEALDNGDEQTIKSLLASDVLIYEGGGVESSLEEYASHHLSADIKFLSGMKREVISQAIFDYGDIAVVTTEARLQGNYREQPVDSKSTETLLLKQDGESWKIIHIHWSSR